MNPAADPGPGAPSPEELGRDLEAAISVLESESPAARPPGRDGMPGGLLRLPPGVVYIVPDLHARGWLLSSLLAGGGAGSDGGASVADELAQGSASILCLGDILHSEGPEAAARWLRALEAAARNPAGLLGDPDMDSEMGMSLRCLQTVLRLKVRFPERFHCLKGNHDNMANLDTGGDSRFYKYADEGAMGAAWFREAYGEGTLALVRRFELDLPVAALGAGFCASHAEPAFPVDEPMLREYRSDPGLVRALIWTANGEARPGSVRRSLDDLLGPGRDGVWFTGHRPIHGDFGIREGGLLVQVHDPAEGRAIAAVSDGDGETRYSIGRLRKDGGTGAPGSGWTPLRLVPPHRSTAS